MRRFGIIIAALGILLVPYKMSAQARVTGIVTDSSGAPVSRAFVEALPISTSAAAATVGDRLNPWMPTDADGRFSLSVPPGRYRIRAKDEADGYPDPVYWLNADPKAIFPQVTVGAKGIPDIHVVLGSKGGVLSGELVDQGSRSPVPKGKITLRDASNSDAYVEVFSDKDGHFQFTVPSKPILVSAGATGYKTVSVAGGGEVTLSAGQHREIVVELPPE